MSGNGKPRLRGRKAERSLRFAVCGRAGRVDMFLSFVGLNIGDHWSFLVLFRLERGQLLVLPCMFALC